MRWTLALTALLLAIAGTIEAQPGQPAGKQSLTDKAVIDLCGGRLARVFAEFGIPDELRAVRENGPERDAVMVKYGTFGFLVRQKTVQSCYFWPGWKGKIQGIEIGNTPEEVVKVLGKNDLSFKNSYGGDDYGWNLKAYDAILWAQFDKDNKVWSVQVAAK